MISRRSLLGLISAATLLGSAAWRSAEAQAPPPVAAVRTESFDAPSIGRPTAYNVILPRDYETSGDKRYPVLYLLHGLTGNYTNWAGMGAGGRSRVWT